MKKILSLLLVLLLSASLFSGCLSTGKLLGGEDRPTEGPGDDGTAQATLPTFAEIPTGTQTATEAPNTQAPAPTERPGEPVSAEESSEAVRLLAEALEKARTLESLGFRLELEQRIDMAEEGQDFDLDMTLRAEGAHTAAPDATWLKGSVSVLGFEIPMESYLFREAGKQTEYSWDDNEKTFYRSETPLSAPEAQEEGPAPEPAAQSWTVTRAEGEYRLEALVKVPEAQPLLRAATSFLPGTGVLDEFSDLFDFEQEGAQDPEEAQILQEGQLLLCFRVDPETGYLTGFRLDMSPLMQAVVASEEETKNASVFVLLSLDYFDFDAVPAITAPESYKEHDWEDWDPEDGDEENDAAGIDWDEFDWDALGLDPEAVEDPDFDWNSVDWSSIDWEALGLDPDSARELEDFDWESIFESVPAAPTEG